MRKTKILNLIKHPMLIGSVLMVGGSLGTNIINYVYHLVMGRMLGPVDYGALVSLYSLIYIFAIVPISTSFAIVKFISSASEKKEKIAIYNSVNKLMLYIALGTFVLLILISPLIAGFLHIPSILVMSLAPSIFFSLLTLVNQAAMQAVLNFVGVVIPNFTSSITKFALGVLFVTIGWSVGGAMVAYIIGSTLSYLSSIRLAKEFIKKKKNSSDLKPILKYAFPVLVQALAFTSILSMDVILVKHFLPSHEAGVYSALSTLGRIIYFALYPVTTVMFPIVSGRRSRGEKYRNIFYIAFFVTFSVSICIVGFYYFFPELAIRNLYGQSYLGAEKELVWMGIFMMFYTLSYLLVNFLLSIGRTKIVIFPLIVSIAQVVAIWIMHDTIFQVIKASIMVTAPLFVSLSLYMGYNQIQRIYAKK